MIFEDKGCVWELKELLACPWKCQECEHSVHNGLVCEQGSFDVCPHENERNDEGLLI